MGVKPKSGGVVDEFKSKLKQLGRTQRTLKSQDKQISTEMSKARDRGATRKQLVKGRKFQRDSRRAQREGDKLKKDVLRIGKAKGGKVDDKKKTKKPLGGKLKKPRPGSYDYQLQETMKPPYKRKEMERGGVAEKPIYKFKDEKGNFKKPKAEGKPSKINERPKAVPLKKKRNEKRWQSFKTCRQTKKSRFSKTTNTRQK